MTTNKIKTATGVVLAGVCVFGGYELIETAFNLLAFHPIGTLMHGGETALAVIAIKPLRWMRRESSKRAAAGPTGKS